MSEQSKAEPRYAIERQSYPRVFAREFHNVTFWFEESLEECAPTFGLLPTGQRAARVYVVGVLYQIGETAERWNGYIDDPTGTVLVSVDKEQPGAMRRLPQLIPLDAPIPIGLVAKPCPVRTDDGVLRMEGCYMEVVDKELYNRWIRETIEETQQRIKTRTEGTSTDARIAAEIYGHDLVSYRTCITEARMKLTERTTQ